MLDLMADRYEKEFVDILGMAALVPPHTRG